VSQLPIKQRLFCYEHVVDPDSATHADADSALLANPDIQDFIADIQERIAVRTSVSVESLTEEYEDARTKAKAENQISAMVSCTTGKAKLHGLVSGNGTTVNVQQNNTQESTKSGAADFMAKVDRLAKHFREAHDICQSCGRGVSDDARANMSGMERLAALPEIGRDLVIEGWDATEKKWSKKGEAAK